MEQTQIDKIIRLGKKHTYKETEKSYLDKLERDLYRVIDDDKLNEAAIEVLAKFLFERKKYKESLSQFSNLLEIDENKISAYYGMYKCYLMLNDFSNSYKNIVYYVQKRNSNKIKKGTEIIFSSYDIIFNNNYDYEIYETENFLMNEIKDKELKEKYTKLVEAYNLRNYSKCLLLVDECEKISRRKKIFVEFSTFKQLLNQVNIITREKIKNNLSNYYKDLQDSLDNNNFIKMIQILNVIPKNNLKNDKLIYNSIYVLIKNNYIKEAQEILNSFIKNTKNNIIIQTLQKTINNQIEYNKLSQEEKENYHLAIDQGHIYYNEGNIEYAYYTYEFGKYTTNNNIFLYYIGKMLFKLHQYKEAEQYFKEYIKVGSDKLSKAYLYLATISKIKRKYKKALYYSEMVSSLDKIIATDFQMYYIYDVKNEDEDYIKMLLQEKESMYQEIFNDTNNELYAKIKILIQEGKKLEANQLIKTLEQNSEKTQEEKECLILIKQNKKIYTNQNKLKY